MGYFEAREDGIKITSDGYCDVYLVPCKLCGKEIRSTNYIRRYNYLCDHCKEKKKQKAKELRPLYKIGKEEGYVTESLDRWVLNKMLEEKMMSHQESGFFHTQKRKEEFK